MRGNSLGFLRNDLIIEYLEKLIIKYKYGYYDQ